VKIAIGLCNDLRQQVRQAEIDAALTLEGSDGPPEREDTFSRILALAQLSFIVSKRQPSGTKLATRTDLIGRTFLLPDPDGALPALLRAWFGASNHRPRFESAGSIDGVKRGIQNSDVIGVLPNYTVAVEVESSSLFELKVRERLPALCVGLTVQQPPLEASPLHEMIRQIELAIEKAHFDEPEAITENH
jgi:DNA-binding transcriptional LysR family regulator